MSNPIYDELPFYLRGSEHTLQGVYDYNDLATKTTPLAVIGGAGFVDVPNDGLGPQTNVLFPLPDVLNVWDSVAGEFDWDGLSLGDAVGIRLDLEVTTTAPNQDTEVELALGTGAGIYSIPFIRAILKTSGVYQLSRWNSIYLGDANTLDNGAVFQIKSDANLDVQVNGWYIRVIPHTITL